MEISHMRLLTIKLMLTTFFASSLICNGKSEKAIFILGYLSITIPATRSFQSDQTVNNGLVQVIYCFSWNELN